MRRIETAAGGRHQASVNGPRCYITDEDGVIAFTSRVFVAFLGDAPVRVAGSGGVDAQTAIGCIAESLSRSLLNDGMKLIDVRCAIEQAVDLAITRAAHEWAKEAAW